MTIAEFNAVYMLHYKPLLFFANSLFKDMDKAQDFTQDAFVRLWEARNSGTVKTSKSYLFLGLKNRFLNEMRHLRTLESYRKSHLDEEELDWQRLQQEAVKYEMISLLYEGIERLAPRQKEVILSCLKSDGKKSRMEIAAMLKISIQTLKEHRLKAYLNLRRYCLPRLKILFNSKTVC